MRIGAQSNSTWSSGWGFSIHMPWYLDYGTPRAPPSTGIVPDFVEVDWVFIVGFCLSLMALLLTYDGVCGERQEGTLRLLLAGPVPRFAVLLGKFLAAWVVLAVALVTGLVVDLIILSLFGPIALDGAVWSRVLLMLAVSLLYLASFVGLGLFVSARSERPASSLVSLLLLWTVLLVLLPNTTAGVVSYFRQSQENALTEEYQIWSQKSPVAEDDRPPAEFVETFSQFLSARLRIRRQFEGERLRRHLEPVELGRSLNRISPYGTFQFAMESLSGTGLARHQRFIAAAQAFERSFRQFVDERDQADADSYHLFGLAPGLSAEPVPIEVVPRFHEDVSLAATLSETTTDLTLLALFALIGFMAANAAFLRGSVT
jgi:ABC-type transport system involved in multi-copper enzyme maturation permease subunit